MSRTFVGCSAILETHVSILVRWHFSNISYGKFVPGSEYEVRIKKSVQIFEIKQNLNFLCSEKVSSIKLQLFNCKVDVTFFFLKITILV